VTLGSITILSFQPPAEAGTNAEAELVEQGGGQ